MYTPFSVATQLYLNRLCEIFGSDNPTPLLRSNYGISEHYDPKVLAKFGQTLNTVSTNVNSGIDGLVNGESDGEDDITGHVSRLSS